MFCRNTFVEVNLNNIEQNVKKLIQKYNKYTYYFGVVKADCYGHNGIEVVKSIIKGGCNYLAVATLDEALKIREEIKDIPILCLGVSSPEFINLYIENNITMTISSIEQLENIINMHKETLHKESLARERLPEESWLKERLPKENLSKELLPKKASSIPNLSKLKVHIKLNTGMNRLGISEKTEFIEAYKKLKQNNIIIEGIYTHIYDAENQASYNMQINKFKNFIKEIDITKIPIIHTSASEALVRYKKEDYITGCRLGIVMYGFISDKKLELKSTFSLYSEIIQINKLKAGETLGYCGAYKAERDCLIGVVPIGYADGIIRKNTGRTVFINNNEYQIVGNICMDMLFIKIDEKVKLNDKVAILKDNKHIEAVAKHLETIEYEVLCSIGKRVERIYRYN